MALTTEDIKQIETIVTKVVDRATMTMATKDDLKQFATKTDLDRMEARITTALGLLQRDTFTRLDEHEVRISRLEQARR